MICRRYKLFGGAVDVEELAKDRAVEVVQEQLERRESGRSPANVVMEVQVVGVGPKVRLYMYILK